jgi:hypothetical protein
MLPFSCPKCGKQFELSESGCPACGWLRSIETTAAPKDPGSAESGQLQNQAEADATGGVRLRRGSRKWPWIVLAFVLLILVLRETGILSLDVYQSNSIAQTNSSYEGVFFPGFGDQQGRTTGTKTKLKSVATEAAADALRDMQVSGAVEFERLDIAGSYWLPLFKQGQCDFVASYSGGNGKVKGHIECTVKGICSAYTYRKLMGQLVAKEIARVIRYMVMRRQEDRTQNR